MESHLLILGNHLLKLTIALIFVYSIYLCIFKLNSVITFIANIMEGIILIIFKIFKTGDKYESNKELDEDKINKELDKRYRRSYSIDFENKKIFDLNYRKFRNLDYFKKLYEEIPTLETIKKRIINEYNKKQIFIDSENHNIQYLVNIDDFKNFFFLNEIYFDKEKSSINYVYLSNINNSKNKIFYKLNTYPTNIFYKELEKVKNNLKYKNIRIIDQSDLLD